MSSVLNSDKLIKSIKRRAMIPSSQETFIDSDFLEMASEEVNIGLMSYIISSKEEYLIYYFDIELEVGKRRYDIPSRAHGNKLRQASVVDSASNVYDLMQINLDELAEYENVYTVNTRRLFYCQNNQLVLTGDWFNSGDTLRMHFYMRPSKLIENDRYAIIQSVSDIEEIDQINSQTGSISNISVAAKAVITSTAHGLTSGDRVLISSSNSTPSINGSHTISVIDANSFSIDFTTTVSGSTGTWNKLVDVKQLTLNTFPNIFTVDSLYDLDASKSPNKIIEYDIQCNSVNSNTKTISLIDSDFYTDESFIGTYLTLSEETFVPNIPTELHPILAQRVAVACLEALGDEAGKQSAERKLAQMEKEGLALINDRVEGASKKVRNRYSPLKESLYGTRRRRRY
jgi:hypothetical protein